MFQADGPSGGPSQASPAHSTEGHQHGSGPKPQPKGPRDAPPAPKPAGASVDLTADLHAQIEAAMKDLSQAPIKPAGIRGPRVVQGGREHRKGRVVSVGPSDIFVEFGPRELGVVPRMGWPEDQLPKTGDEVELIVERRDPNEGIYICVRPGTVQKADWEMLEEGQVVEAPVVGVVKGGIELEVAGHRAFMPASQVSLDRIENFEPLIGQKLTCQVQRVDRRGKGNIVLSRRPILEREREERAKAARDSLAEGAVVSGKVRKIMPFGAFVDLGGVDGLIHVGDMTHERVGHGEKFVQKYVKEGDQVTVQILKLDWENNRIGLGLKQLKEDPFAVAARDITEGAEVSGRVKSLVEFGAFVEIAPGMEGLVHISEMAWKRVNAPAEVLKLDEIVRCKVLKIDPSTRRVSLSIKALIEPPKSAKPKEDKGPSREEILKETPQLRRMREKAGHAQKKGGLDFVGGGIGLGDLKLPG